jgi:hypothetical protein
MIITLFSFVSLKNQPKEKQDVNYKFMHVCGTHQDTLVKHGLDVHLGECSIDISAATHEILSKIFMSPIYRKYYYFSNLITKII